MDYSAVSQAAKRFEQKSEVNHEINEVIQKMIIALKEEWMSNVDRLTENNSIIQQKKKKRKGIFDIIELK